MLKQYQNKIKIPGREICAKYFYLFDLSAGIYLMMEPLTLPTINQIEQQHICDANGKYGDCNEDPNSRFEGAE